MVVIKENDFQSFHFDFLYFKNPNHLQSLLEYWIPIYNTRRPSISAKYLLTPEEVFKDNNIDTGSIKNSFELARKERILFKQNHKCNVC
ncbi:MAG: hypothetical protein KDK54_18850 [Leptospiraceae bacterium]|nr:hypothetical protein [Leptospiraceae bacterium]